MAMISVIALSVILLCVAIRFYWAKERGSTTDTWYHLHLSDRIRDERRLPDRIDRFLIPGPYDYPPGLHILLAAFPRRFVLRFKWLFAPVMETIHIGFLVGVAYWLTQDVQTAIVTGSIYATYTTQILQFSVLTPRVFGSVLFSVLVLLVVWGIQTGTPLALAAAVVVGAVLLFVHKMSSQTVLFLFVFFSIVEVAPLYLALVAGMVVLATVASGGHYLTILRGHVNIIDFWRRQHRAGRGPGEFMRRYGNTAGGDDDPGSTLEQILGWIKRNEWSMFVADNAWTFLLALVLIWGQYADTALYTLSDGIIQLFAVWAMFILGFAILTEYVPYFKLVGDGYKYFMWGAFPTAIVLAIVLPLSNPWVATGFVCALLGSALYGYIRMYLRVKKHNPSARTIMTEGAGVIDFLDDADGQNVLALPFGMNFHLLYNTELNILFHQNPKVEAESAFPVPLEPLQAIVTEYDIDYVVMDTTIVDIEAFDTRPFREVFSENDYVVLELEEE